MLASNTSIALVWNGTTFPFLNVSMSENASFVSPTTGNYSGSSLCTFAPKTFFVAYSSLPLDVLVEAPCSNASSSFDYSLSASLPAGFSFTSNSSNSTQKITLGAGGSFGGSNFLSFSSNLSNAQPFNSETKS